MKADIAGGVSGLLCLIGAAAFAARPTPLGQLLSMFALVLTAALLVVFVGRAIWHWRKLGLPSLLAPALLLAALPLGAHIGRSLRAWQFQRDLPRYQVAADWAKSQAVVGTSVRVALPPEAADLAYATFVEARPSCGTVVDFYWGSGFPVKHTVRRYAENPASFGQPQCLEDWTIRRRRAEHWVEMAD